MKIWKKSRHALVELTQYCARHKLTKLSRVKHHGSTTLLTSLSSGIQIDRDGHVTKQRQLPESSIFYAIILRKRR